LDAGENKNTQNVSVSNVECMGILHTPERNGVRVWTGSIYLKVGTSIRP
jgi:hypothetical protein